MNSNSRPEDAVQTAFPSPSEVPPFVMSSDDYLSNPEEAFRQMRAGVTVVIEPMTGYARLVLGGELLSNVNLD